MIWLIIEVSRTHRHENNPCELEIASVNHIFICGAGDNDINQYLKKSIRDFRWQSYTLHKIIYWMHWFFSLVTAPEFARLWLWCFWISHFSRYYIMCKDSGCSFRKFLRHLELSFNWKPGISSYVCLQHLLKSKLFLDRWSLSIQGLPVLAWKDQLLYGLFKGLYDWGSNQVFGNAMYCTHNPSLPPHSVFGLRIKGVDSLKAPFEVFSSILAQLQTVNCLDGLSELCLQAVESAAEEAIHDHCRWVIRVNIY